MIKHPMYDVAVREVRGEASIEEKKELHLNVFEWRDALQNVIDEVDSQLISKSEEFEDRIAWAERTGDESEISDAHNSYKVWKSRARTFKKHVSGRLLAVKRMCQEQVEGAEEAGFGSIELAMKVVSAAVALLDSDNDTDEAWDEANELFVESVKAYQASFETD